mgnify:CR=1 FL=1
MRRELLASKKKETGLSLDPRTKLALLVTIALFVLSGGGGAASKQFAPILAAVPLIGKIVEGIGYLFCFIWRQLYIATMGAPPPVRPS